MSTVGRDVGPTPGDPIAAAIGYAPTQTPMDETLDTSAKEVPRRLPGRPGVAYIAREAEPLPVDPPAAGTCRYYLSTRNGKVYALELKDG